MGAPSFIETLHDQQYELMSWIRTSTVKSFEHHILNSLDDDDDGGGGGFWHAADTAPLEGLPILRCAIYDPLEGLQISKMRLAQMGV